MSETAARQRSRMGRRRGRREEALRWVLGILGGLWLGLFPLISRFSYVRITQTKWEIAMVLGGVTLLAVLILLALGLWRSVRWRDPARWLIVGMFAWMALTMVLGSAADTVNEQGSLAVWMGNGKRNEGMSTQLCYLTLFLCFSLLRPKLRPMLIIASAGMAVFFGVIMGQYAGYNVLGFYPGFPWYANTRITYEFQGTMGQIDMVSGYLCIMSPLLLGWWVAQGGRDGWYALPAGAMSVLLSLFIDVTSGLLALLACMGLLVCLMLCRPEYRRRGLVVLGLVLCCFTVRKLTGLPWLDGLAEPWCLPPRTDAPSLPLCGGDEAVIFPWNVSLKKLLPAALGLALMAVSPLVGRHPGRAIRLRWVVLVCAVLGVACVLGVALAPIPESMGTLWELHEVLNGRMQDSFGSERWGIWHHTLLVARENLLFGTGPDTFYAVMKQYIADNGVAIVQNFDNPHNLFLSVLMQNGLPALVLMLAGMVWIVLRSLGQRSGFMLGAAAAGYLVQGFFVFSNIIVTPMFWVVLGMAAASDGRWPPRAPISGVPGQRKRRCDRTGRKRRSRKG